MVSVAGTIYSQYITVKDVAYPLTIESVPFYEVNLHIEDNDIQYGNARNVTAVAVAGSTISFKDGDLKDILTKNNVGGAVGHISVVATLKEM